MISASNLIQGENWRAPRMGGAPAWTLGLNSPLSPLASPGQVLGSRQVPARSRIPAVLWARHRVTASLAPGMELRESELRAPRDRQSASDILCGEVVASEPVNSPRFPDEYFSVCFSAEPELGTAQTCCFPPCPGKRLERV